MVPDRFGAERQVLQSNSDQTGREPHLRQEAEAELEEQGNEQYDPNSPLGEALTRFNEQWAVALSATR